MERKEESYEAELDTFALDIAINSKNFPDEIFRKYVNDRIDKDKNGKLKT